jgi:uncharacterized membrane protein
VASGFKGRFTLWIDLLIGVIGFLANQVILWTGVLEFSGMWYAMFSPLMSIVPCVLWSGLIVLLISYQIERSAVFKRRKRKRVVKVIDSNLDENVLIESDELGEV